MALRMKHWAGLVLAGCAWVALELLPVSSWDEPTRPAPLPEEAYEQALFASASAANAKLQRIRLAERVIPLTLAGEGSLTFEVPEGTNPEDVHRVREGAEQEMSEAAGGDQPVSVGLFHLGRPEGSYPGLSSGLDWDGEYYFGTRDGRPYCVTVLSAWRRRDEYRLRGVGYTGSWLGLCGVIARHGLPGLAAEAWLVNGGTAMAALAEPSSPASFTFTSAWGEGFARRASLGIMLAGRHPVMGFPTLAQEQCFAGVAQGCATLFLEPGSAASVGNYGLQRSDATEPIATTPLSAVQSYSAMYPSDQHVVADLVEEFGAERFHRWWTADGPTDEAFLAAFGVPAGEWYGRRVALLVQVTKPGPSPSPNGWAGAVLILTLAAALAGAWARGRRVA